jgi:hypothetical protein
MFLPKRRSPLGGDLRSLTLSPALGQGPSAACNLEFLGKRVLRNMDTARVYRSPYKLAAIAANGADDNSCGRELCLIAARV